MSHCIQSTARRSSHSRLVWALVSSLLVSGGTACAGASGGRGVASTKRFGSGLARVEASPEIAKLERAMSKRVNRDRKERGLPPLLWDPALADVARHHSADMRDHGFFEHESPHTGTLEDRLDAAGYLFATARENLSEAPDVEKSQDGLLASPPHFANLMATDVTHLGIGIVRGGPVAPDNLSVTQVFATPSKQQSPARAKQAIERKLREVRAQRELPKARVDSNLSELARHHIESLDQPATEASTAELNDQLGPTARDAGLSALLVSVQVIDGAESWVVPSLLLEERRVALGVAVRKATAERGRPALQVLLLAGPLAE